MRQLRTHSLGVSGPLYNVECKVCGLGAIANNYEAARNMAIFHVKAKEEHTVRVAGRGMLTQIISIHTIREHLPLSVSKPEAPNDLGEVSNGTE